MPHTITFTEYVKQQSQRARRGGQNALLHASRKTLQVILLVHYIRRRSEYEGVHHALFTKGGDLEGRPPEATGIKASTKVLCV